MVTTATWIVTRTELNYFLWQLVSISSETIFSQKHRTETNPGMQNESVNHDLGRPGKKIEEECVEESLCLGIIWVGPAQSGYLSVLQINGR